LDKKPHRATISIRPTNNRYFKTTFEGSTIYKGTEPVQQNAETAFLQDVNYKISVLWRIIDQVGFLVKFIATWVIEII